MHVLWTERPKFMCASSVFDNHRWTKVIIVFGFHFRYLLTAKYRERVQFRNVCNSTVMSNNKAGKENDVHFFF